MEFDPKNANAPKQPQSNRHQMDAWEMARFGDLLVNIGETLTSAAGRLDRYDTKHHPLFNSPGRGVETKSPSALNDAVEALCMHSWNIRNQVNEKVRINQLISSDEIEAWTEEIAVLANAKQTTSDEHLAKALETSIASLRQRIDKARETTGIKSEDNYLEPSSRLNTLFATLSEDDEIDVLMYFYGGADKEHEETFGAVGKDQLDSAIRRLKREGITHIYQLLNAPKQMILDMVADKDDIGWQVQTVDVLTEVLHSFGYKWRTGGKNTRFDLPVGRFGFSIEAYRTRSERRAATAFLNTAKGKKGAFLGAALRTWVEGILDNAHEVAAITKENNSITSDKVVELWFDAACGVLDKFKGVIPERLWLIEIEADPDSLKHRTNEVVKSLPKTSRGFRSKLVDAITGAKDREVFLRNEYGQELGLTTTFHNNEITQNRYLPTDENAHPQEYQILSVHQLVHVITQIIFEWIKSMEVNAMQDTPLPSAAEALGCIHVWDTALAQHGWMPLAWRTENLVPDEINGEDHFALMEPIKLGEQLEYEKA